MTDRTDYAKSIQQALDDHQVALDYVRDKLMTTISEAAHTLITCFESGNRLYLCGNGGSAADAQHIAAEFTGRFLRDRKPLPAVALTTDTSALTAIGNDFGIDSIFSKQIEALMQPWDVLLAISTSGNSSNIVAAVHAAKKQKSVIIGLLGRDGGALRSLVDQPIVVASQQTARIQEMHILIGHVLCDIVDQHFASR